MVGCKNSSNEEDEEKLEMDGMQKAMRQEFFMTRGSCIEHCSQRATASSDEIYEYCTHDSNHWSYMD